MLAPRKICKEYYNWNSKWRAPFGRTKIKEIIPDKYRYNSLFTKLIGVFGIHPNNDCDEK